MISAGYNGHICLIVFMYIHRKIFINTKNKQTQKSNNNKKKGEGEKEGQRGMGWGWRDGGVGGSLTLLKGLLYMHRI